MKVIVIKREDPINFIQGNINYLASKVSRFMPFMGLEDYILEQALLRAYLCRECMENGRCVVCKCTTPNMFFSPNKTDSKGKWGVMVEKDTWEENKVNDENWKQFVEYIENGNIKEYTPSKSNLDELLKEFMDILSKSTESSTDGKDLPNDETKPNTEGEK